jgi:homoserine O-acetyltransferase
VSSKVFNYNSPFRLNSGTFIDGFKLMYETYGHLDKNNLNAILVCPALSGDQHAAGYYSPDDLKPGWWDSAIGPNKPIDTNKYFVVSVNNLGGCSGSTGPKSKNPKTGQYYGSSFPIVTVKDFINSQLLLAKHIGINKWCAVIGGSLGGMQALQWAIDYPDRVSHAIILAAPANLTAQNIAFNEIARMAIKSDLKYCEGAYLENNQAPTMGLMVARMLGHVTYLSDDGMGMKFGRQLLNKKLNYNFEKEFQVENYLHYQADKFANYFDANTYLLMTKALDYFDPASDYGDSLKKALSRVKSNFLVVSFSSDWLFTPQSSKEIVTALISEKKTVTYVEIDTQDGHDSFLKPIPDYFRVLSAYIDQMATGE